MLDWIETMESKPRRIRRAKKPSFVKTFMDPELAREWGRFARDYPYLFWVQAMNIKTVEEWFAFIADKEPNLTYEARLPGSAEEFICIARARRDAYFCLARGFAEPSRQLAKGLLDGSFENSLKGSISVLFEDSRVEKGLKLLNDFRQTFKGADPEKLQKDLAPEHLTVFYDGYFPWLSCYESIYRSEKQIMGELTAQVMREYSDAGFAISKERGNDPPDDLRLEVEFMYRLCELELQAWRSRDKNEALRYLNAQNSFLREHLIEWVPFLCEDLVKTEFKEGVGRKFHRAGEAAEKYAVSIVEIDFYRSLGFITRALLEHDCSQVEAMLRAAQALPEQEIFSFAEVVEQRDSSGEKFSLIKR